MLRESRQNCFVESHYILRVSMNAIAYCDWRLCFELILSCKQRRGTAEDVHGLIQRMQLRCAARFGIILDVCKDAHHRLTTWLILACSFHSMKYRYVM